jgi:hypothetical protein
VREGRRLTQLPREACAPPDDLREVGRKLSYCDNFCHIALQHDIRRLALGALTRPRVVPFQGFAPHPGENITPTPVGLLYFCP